jgi:ubiquinone/menaquinone biosynthesis C-methylase UbiE
MVVVCASRGVRCAKTAWSTTCVRRRVSDERYRCSFDGVAEAYERSRPGYAPAAVEWISQRLPLGRVLDLGAGTGKLTRQLVPYALEVVAVEPGDEMRRVLQEAVPGVEALFGTAEEIPLPDESVDVVTVAQAVHWFELDVALAEMHRVLRPMGGLAIVWNERDENEPLMRAIADLLEEVRPALGEDKLEEQILASPLFTSHDECSFPNAELLDADRAVEQVSSISAVSAAAPDERDRVLAELRALVGDGPVDFHMITHVLAADRA